MKCKDLMHRDLQWVAGDANVRELARLMRDRSMGFLLVSGAVPGQLAGVITDRDLAVRACTEDRCPQDIRVIDIASREDQGLGVAEKIMRKEQISRLVILNAQDQPVGVLSLTNILFGDLAIRALRTARGVLAREEEGPHTPLDQIKLTPSTPDDEETASHNVSTATGRQVSANVRLFP